MFSNFQKKRGFTLVELLVVVAIIALLVSILLPSLGQARSAAKQVVCMSNMHQWSLGVVAYSMDNRDFFPSRFWRYDNGGVDENHNGLVYYYVENRINLLDIFLRPYIQDVAITRCPGNPSEIKDWDVQLEECVQQGINPNVKGNYGLYVGYPEDISPTGISWGPVPLNSTKWFIPPKKISEARPGLAVTGCVVQYDDINQWVYYHPKFTKNSIDKPENVPTAFADGHAVSVSDEDLVIFQAYTSHSWGGSYWWADPKKSY